MVLELGLKLGLVRVGVEAGVGESWCWKSGCEKSGLWLELEELELENFWETLGLELGLGRVWGFDWIYGWVELELKLEFGLGLEFELGRIGV